MSNSDKKCFKFVIIGTNGQKGTNFMYSIKRTDRRNCLITLYTIYSPLKNVLLKVTSKKSYSYFLDFSKESKDFNFKKLSNSNLNSALSTKKSLLFVICNLKYKKY